MRLAGTGDVPLMPAHRRVVVLPGDGIGPDVVASALRVIDATGVPLVWETHDIGAKAYEATGDALPAAVVEAVRSCGVALKGPVATPIGAPFRSVNTELRRALDLYAQIRPVRSMDGAPCLFRDVDVLVIRETREDLYLGIEAQPGSVEAGELLRWLADRGHVLPASTGLSIKPLSIEAARRTLRLALEHARRTGRRRVTVVHKASVMRATDGVFLREGLALAREYPDLVVDDMSVDAAAAALVRRPTEFDVVVTTNLYGDVLSDLAAALTGGLGLAPGVNLGDGVTVVEAVHGTAPRLAGRDRANPFAMILCGAMLLDQVGQLEEGDAVRAAVADVVRAGVDVTYDLRVADDDRPPVGTRRATEAVLERLR
jgi:isocitrate dehydrogenase (NAD+)